MSERHEWTLELIDAGETGDPELPFYFATVNGPCAKCGMTRTEARKRPGPCRPVGRNEPPRHRCRADPSG